MNERDLEARQPPAEVEAFGARSVAAQVNAGIINTGDQPTFVSVSQTFSRPQDAYLSPASLWRELNLGIDFERFTGRKWLAQEIDEFVREHECGWFVVEGDAGVGKTSFATVFATQRNLPHHFCSLPSGDDPAVALRSLASQTIALEGLESDLGPNGLPAEAGRPEWLDVLLERAVEQRRHRGEERPLMLVIDAMEDAKFVAGMPFGLVRSLPPGVFVVATRRRGGQALPLATPVRVRALQADLPQNLEDMELHLRRIAEGTSVARLLESEQRDESWFVSTLMDRCRGIWIYLQYVEAELVLGLRGLTELETLPASLWHYYALSLTSLRSQDPDVWDQEVRSLLVSLGSVREPVSLPLACRFAAIEASPRLRRLLDGRWRPFLAVSKVDGEPRYAPIHATFGDFIRGAVNWTAGAAIDQGLVDELREASEWCRRHISERLLRRWAPADAQTARGDGEEADYGWRNICGHLILSDQAAELHELMSLRRKGDSTENEWFALHEAAGDQEGYWSDIELALALAREEVDAAAPGEGGEARAREASYTLIASTLRTHAFTFPAPLLGRLVSEGTWTMAQGLDYAKRVTDPMLRFGLVLELACVEGGVPTSAEKSKQLRLGPEFLDGDFGGRVADLHPFTNLDGARLPEASPVRTELVAIANLPLTAEMKLAAQATIAPILTEREMEEIVEAAGELTPALIPRLASELVAQMSEEQAEKLVRQLLEHLAGEEAEAWRAMTIAALLPYLSPVQVQRLKAEALAAARRASEDVKWGLIASLGAFLSKDELATAATELSRAKELSSAQADALVRIAAALPEEERFDLLPLVAKVEARDRGIALARFGDLMPPQALGQILKLGRRLDDEFDFVLVLGGIPRISAYSALGDMMGLAFLQPQRLSVPRADGIAGRLPPDLLEEALAAAAALKSPAAKARALSSLLPHLPQEQARGLARRLTMEAAAGKGELLQYMGPFFAHLDTEALREAARAGEGMEPGERCLLAVLIRRYEDGELGRDQVELAFELLEAGAKDGSDEEALLTFFGFLVPYLEDDQVRKAFTLAMRYRGRRELLLVLADHLTREEKLAVIDAELPPDRPAYDTDEFITGILPHLDSLEFTYLLERARRINDRHYYVSALRELMPLLGERALEELVATARRQPRDRDRARLLAGLAPEMAPAIRNAIGEELLDLYVREREGDSDPLDYDITHPLGEIVPLLDQAQTSEVHALLLRALEEAPGAPFYGGHLTQNVLPAILPQLDREAIDELRQAVLAFEDGPRRRRFLRQLAPWLPPEVQLEIVEEARSWRAADRAAVLSLIPPEKAKPHIWDCLRSAERRDLGHCIKAFAHLLEDKEVETLCAHAAKVAEKDVVFARDIYVSMIDRLEGEQLEAAVEIAFSPPRINPKQLTALLEGLGPETREGLLKAVFDGNGVGPLGSLQTVAIVVPFLPEPGRRQAIEWVVETSLAEGTDEHLTPLLPFLSHDDLSRFGRAAWQRTDGLHPISRHLDDREAWTELRGLLSEGAREDVMRWLCHTASIPARLDPDFPDRLAAVLVDVQEWWP